MAKLPKSQVSPTGGFRNWKCFSRTVSYSIRVGFEQKKEADSAVSAHFMETRFLTKKKKTDIIPDEKKP